MALVLSRKPKTKQQKEQKWIKSNKSASSQSRQIGTAFKKISSIRTDMRKATQKYGLFKEFVSSNLTDAVIPMTPAAIASAGPGGSPAWDNCFANNTNAALANRVRLGRCYTKMQFTCGNERSPITYSVFHVRLNPKNAEFVTSTYGNNLSLLPINGGYIRGSTPVTIGDASGGGNVMLNPDWFIVKKQWRFTLAALTNTSNTQPTTTPVGTTKNIDYSFPLGYSLGTGRDSWASATADADTAPHLRNYFLVFSDNISTDLQYNQYSILAQTTATYQ
ncbi:MAG: putative capsid protein [Cressdnaviricota sp.]|nr:MAG: putative capsid protein [Cressdnaviricota sp.]